MPQIALTTFVKRYSEKPPQKERAYRKYLTPGGLDFYWPMKSGAAHVTYKGGTLQGALTFVDEIEHAPLRENNKAGLLALSKFLREHERRYFEPPFGLRVSPGGRLSVKVRPEFGIHHEGKRYLVTLWNTKQPEMTRSFAGIAINLMYDTVVTERFEDCRCSLLDLRSGNWFQADATSEEMGRLVLKELQWVDWLFEKIEAEKAA
jgi:hypothetical protein